MREIRTYGSEGGGSVDLPTPITAVICAVGYSVAGSALVFIRAWRRLKTNARSLRSARAGGAGRPRDDELFLFISAFPECRLYHYALQPVVEMPVRAAA